MFPNSIDWFCTCLSPESRLLYKCLGKQKPCVQETIFPLWRFTVTRGEPRYSVGETNTLELTHFSPLPHLMNVDVLCFMTVSCLLSHVFVFGESLRVEATKYSVSFLDWKIYFHRFRKFSSRVCLTRIAPSHCLLISFFFSTFPSSFLPSFLHFFVCWCVCLFLPFFVSFLLFLFLCHGKWDCFLNFSFRQFFGMYIKRRKVPLISEYLFHHLPRGQIYL